MKKWFIGIIVGFLVGKGTLSCSWIQYHPRFLYHKAFIGIHLFLCSLLFTKTNQIVELFIGLITQSIGILLAFSDKLNYTLPLNLVYGLFLLALCQQALGFSPFSLGACLSGSFLGFGIFWSIRHVFSWKTGKMGLGNGDEHLMAALGAWVGIWNIPILIFSASFFCFLFHWDNEKETRIPFGPYLLSAAYGILHLRFLCL